MKNCTICQKEFNNDSTYIEAKKEINKHINSNALMQEDCLCIDCIKDIVNQVVEDAFSDKLDSEDIPF